MDLKVCLMAVNDFVNTYGWLGFIAIQALIGGYKIYRMIRDKLDARRCQSSD